MATRLISTFTTVAIATAFVSPLAHADETGCSAESAKKYGYGDKVMALVWVPEPEAVAFRKLTNQYFDRRQYLVRNVAVLKDKTLS